MSVQVWNELDEPLGVVSGALAAPTASRMRATALTGATAVAIAIGLFAVPRRDAPLNGEPFALAKVKSYLRRRKLWPQIQRRAFAKPSRRPSLRRNKWKRRAGSRLCAGMAARQGAYHRCGEGEPAESEKSSIGT